MKRTVLIAALAAVFMFAFASSAFANWGGWTGTNLAPPWNSAGTTQSVDNPYDTAPGAPRPSTSYVNWSDVLLYGDAGDDNTPHKGYTDSSTLCSVCHSVHYAPVMSGQAGTNPAWGVPNSSVTTDGAYIASMAPTFTVQAQLLLRSNAGTACNYCHIESSIGVKVVYAGDPDIFGYAQNFTSSYAHDYHNAGCNDCHSVHGSNTYDGALSASILHRQPRNRNPQREVIEALTSSNASAPALYATLADAYAGNAINDAYDGDRYLQQSAFCSSCHYVYNTGSEQAIKERGGTAGFTKHHPMKNADASASAPGASDTNNNKRWAWVGSNTCRSCHNAGIDGYGSFADREAGVAYTGPFNDGANGPITGYSDNSFPHYTAGNYRFLGQASEAEYVTDEVCLDCHRDSTGDLGVGKSY